MPSLVPFRASRAWSIISAYRPKSSLIHLPNDILVDRIFSFLEVQDILRLRQTCKHLYNLTHHAVIWKRLLRSTNLAIPPLPPTTRHCLRNLTSLEAERLMVRSVSLATRFKWEDPIPSDVWKFNAYHTISQMCLLPGSQYMVASVSEMNGTNWSLVVFVLDGRYNVVPLAKMATETKAYNVVAKYFTVDGVAGITIAYVRRAWRHRADGNKGININDYSGEHDIDPAYPVKHECHAVHVPLAELDTICDPRFVPGSEEFIAHAASLPAPFHRLCLIRSTRPLESVTLDVLRGKPHLTVVRNPCTLMFKPLDGGPASTLTLNRFPEFQRYDHRILAFRHLPAQNQTLVVRFIDVPATRSKHSVASLEFYSIPHNLTSRPIEEHGFPSDFSFLYEDRIERAFITDYAQPNWFEEDPESDTPAALQARHSKNHVPPPIHIYFRAITPDEGLLRVTFYPKKLFDWVPPSPASSVSSSSVKDSQSSPGFVNVYRYSMDYASPARFVMSSGDSSYRVLPGVYHSLVYSVPYYDRTECPDVTEFFRYYDKELSAREPEEFVEGQPERRRPLKKLDTRRFHKLGKGCRAFAWDDYVGRLVWTMEGTSEVYVVDYSKRPKEDLYGRRMPLAPEQDHEIDPARIDMLFPENDVYQEY